MADDTINYKVNIDASSVADQLQNIKNQVDQAMAMYTFNATLPDPTPRAYAFPGQGFSAQAMGAATNLDQNFGAAAQMAQQNALSFMDSSRLGFQKFSHDVQNAMLMTPVRSPFGVSSGNVSPEIARTAFASMGGTRLGFEAITAWGHDPSMPMTPGMYQRYAREAISDRAVELTMGAIDFTAGATSLGGLAAHYAGFGATAGVLGAGAAVAVPASLATGAFMATMGYDINASMRGRAFARDSSWRNLSGRFSNQDASSLGVSIATAGRSAETIGYGVSQNDAVGMVEQFAQIGGFDTARTAEEFRQKVKTLVDNTRKYVQILGVTQQEAVGMMKEFMDLGIISNVGAGAGMGMNMAAQAYRAGYTPTEFHRFGMQSAEMVRGTGIMMGAGYTGGQGALAGIKGMMQTGVLPLEIANQLGGAEQAAATMTRVGYNFGMSEAGLTYFAARDYLGGAPGALNPQQAIAAATGRIRDVNDYLNFRGAQPRMTGQVGAEALYRGQANWYLEQFRMAQRATPGLQLNEDTFAGFLGNITNDQMSDPERRLMFATIADAQAGGTARRAGQLVSETARIATDARPSVFTSVADVAKNTLAGFLGTRQVATAATDVGNWFDRIVGNIQRAGSRGEILGDVLAGMGLRGLSPLARAYGVDSLELNNVTFDVDAVGRGLKTLGTTGPVSEETKLGQIAAAALQIDNRRILVVEESLAKVGLKPFAGGTVEERVRNANEEYTLIEARAKSGSREAQAVLDTTTKGEFVATIAGAGGFAGKEVHDYMKKIQVATKGTVIKDFEDLKNKFVDARTKIAADWQYKANAEQQQMLAGGTPAGAGMSLEDAYRYAPGVARDESQELAILSELNSGKLKLATYDRAIARGAKENVARAAADSLFDIATRLSKDTEGLQAQAAIMRLTSPAAQSVVAATLIGAGMNVSGLDLTTTQGITAALRQAPETARRSLLGFAGSINYASTVKGSIEKQQLNLLNTLAGTDEAITTTLSQMGVTDMSMATPQMMQEATNKLMVGELRTIAAAVGTGTGGRALRVINVAKEEDRP